MFLTICKEFCVPFKYMSYLFKKPLPDSQIFKEYGNYCINRIAIILWLIFLFGIFVLYFTYSFVAIPIMIFIIGMNSIIFSLTIPKIKSKH